MYIYYTGIDTCQVFTIFISEIRDKFKLSILLFPRNWNLMR